MQSDRWVTVSPSQFRHEDEGLGIIRDLLPDVEPFRAWSNFEFRDTRGRWHEVDLLVLARDTLYLVELKYYSGTLRGNDHRWLRDGRPAEDSPLKLARRKAQYLASVLQQRLREHLHERGEHQVDVRDYVPFVQEAVFLHHPKFECQLPQHARQGIYGLDGYEETSGLAPISELLLAPARRETISARKSALFAGLMQHIGLVPRRQREAGSWVIDDEPLDNGDGWQDWPAFHRLATTDRYRIRFFIPNPEGTRAEEQALKRRIEYEYRLLSRLRHDGLQVPHDIVSDELGIGLVYREDSGSRLDLWLATDGGTLNLGQQLDIVRQVAEALDYAHRHRVVHRGLAPSAVSVRERSSDGHAVTVANWDAVGRVPGTQLSRVSSTGQSEVEPEQGHPGAALADEDQLFEAPEGRWSPNADRVRLDVFALGAVTFYLLTNQVLPAQDPGALVDRLRRDGGLDLAAELPQIPSKLRELVLQATHPRPSERTPSVSVFLQQLEQAEKEFAAPAPVEEPDPLEARPGDVLGGRFTYQRKLGSGSTAVGILVTDSQAGDAQRVLKVAKDHDAAERLEAEERVLGQLNHDRVVRLIQHVTLAGRRALVLQHAGEATLAEMLTSKRSRLSLDLLERWGGDLLDALVMLDSVGINHRDIKPPNLGVHKPAGAKTETHLVLFDFSMAGTGGRALHAGTPPYLDPFLGGSRSTYDSAAERYGAAVVLYEMATGRLPQYGDDPEANPASVNDDVTVSLEAFDPSVAEDLAAFFRSALSRDVGTRHDTAEEMLSAWRAIFRGLGRYSDDTKQKVDSATLDTTLGESGLSARAISVVEPAGVGTVADLLELDSTRLNRLLDRETKTTGEEIRKRITAWRKEFGPQLADRRGRGKRGDDANTMPDPISAAELLASKEVHPRSSTRRQAARLILGLEAGLDPFASQQELARGVGRSAPRGHQLIKEMQEAFSREQRTKDLLDQLVEVLTRALDSLGGVATVQTLTGEMLGALPDVSAGSADKADRVAAGLLRLALDRYQEHVVAAAEEPLAKRRRGSRLALLATDPVLLDAAEAAAAAADGLVVGADEAGEPVVPQQRAAREVRARFTEVFRDGSERRPPAITDLRLVRLAAQTSGSAALSTRGELHLRTLAASTAVRLALSGIAQRTELSPEELAARVRARFPDLDPLPARPDLDAIVDAAGVGLRYSTEHGTYRAPGEDRSDSTGFPTHHSVPAPTPTESQLLRGDHLARVLRDSVSTRSFLALGMPAPNANEPGRAARVLRERYSASVLDVTELLIERMRETAEGSNLPWHVVRAADAAQPGSRDARGLHTLVDRALPAVTEYIDDLVLAGEQAAEPVILTELSPLARYGHLGVVARWSDLAAKRTRPLWLVLPQLSWMRGAVVDSQPLQLGSNGQFVELDEKWLREQESEVDFTAERDVVSEGSR
ncbi:BREX system serine/threonine kinase PglW [Prauserella halophila]|uniref:non-specific serine/threonine protein kinase n=1 Tax=Prauserella halophila TaxID=185641 RepID=A0ABN1VZL2_9PSEU|nr:BREX system serine/threonine kinase PglW [Prauserella halophila]MCP2235248.1 Serine/threonine protein kinase [Prauserella halophila]